MWSWATDREILPGVQARCARHDLLRYLSLVPLLSSSLVNVTHVYFRGHPPVPTVALLVARLAPPLALRLRLRQILADIRAGLVAAPLVVAFNAIIAGMIFSPGDELEDSMSNGVVLAFVTTCSTGAVMLLLSPLPIVTGGDAFLAAMYGREMKPALLDQDEPFATLVVSMAMCSLFLGVTFWVLGAAQAGVA